MATTQPPRDEQAEAERLAKLTLSGFIDLVLIAPVGNRKKRVYFRTDAGAVHCLTCPASDLDRPSYFLRRVASRLGMTLRHRTEGTSPRACRGLWRAEVVAAESRYDSWRDVMKIFD